MSTSLDDLPAFVNGTTMMYVGTHDDRLRAHGAVLSGARFDRAASRLEVILSEAAGAAALAVLRRNGLAAVVVGAAESQGTFQFKGRVEGERAGSTADDALAQVFWTKIFTLMTAGGMPTAQWVPPPPAPHRVVTIKVTDIFSQTPG